MIGLLLGSGRERPVENQYSSAVSWSVSELVSWTIQWCNGCGSLDSLRSLGMTELPALARDDGGCHPERSRGICTAGSWWMPCGSPVHRPTHHPPQLTHSPLPQLRQIPKQL